MGSHTHEHPRTYCDQLRHPVSCADSASLRLAIRYAGRLKRFKYISVPYFRILCDGGRLTNRSQMGTTVTCITSVPCFLLRYRAAALPMYYLRCIHPGSQRRVQTMWLRYLEPLGVGDNGAHSRVVQMLGITRIEKKKKQQNPIQYKDVWSR